MSNPVPIINQPRRRSHPARLFVILGLVFILVSLPILPLRFLGIPGPGPQISDLGHWLFGNKPKPQSTIVARPQAVAHHPLQQVRLLEQAAQDLLLKCNAAPSEPSLQNQAGLVYFELGEMDKATQHFQRAVDLARVKLIDISRRQRAYQMQGNLTAALTSVQESTQASVELSAAHSNLARVYERLGDHAQVVAQLEQLSKDSVVGEGNMPAAVSEPAQVTQNPAVMRLLSQGQMLMSARQYCAGLQIFRNALALDPQCALAHHQLGLAAAMTGNGHLAVQELQIATQLKPGDAVAHNNLGLAELSIGKIPQAQTEFEKAVALDPGLIDGFVNLGDVYSSSGNYAAAGHAFEQAVRHNPNSAVAHNDLGSVYSLQGNSEAAINQFQQALAISPDMASAHYGLGLALYNQKNYPQAVSELKRALTLDPGLEGAHAKIDEAIRKAGVASGGAYGFN